MILTMYVPASDELEEDERVLDIAVEETLLAANLGYNPWFTEHHFRGPWHSNPIQFASYMAPQIPRDRYLGFGVLSTPYYNPVRLIESMNLLDQLTHGRTLFGLGSGFKGVEPAGLGVDAEYHGSGQATRDSLEIMQRLWDFRTGDPTYEFSLPTHRGSVQRRVMPAPYRKRTPTIIRTAARNAAVVDAAQNGWPAFLGVFGSESPLADQFHLYYETLMAANHPPDVVAHCLKWNTCDWLSVVVAETEEQAHAKAEEAKAEAVAIRQRYTDKYGSIQGPVMHRKPEQSVAAAFTQGGDMSGAIVGTPDQISEKLQQLVDIGFNHVIVRFMGEWTGATRHISEESMRLFAREVMPRFRPDPVPSNGAHPNGVHRNGELVTAGAARNGAAIG